MNEKHYQSFEKNKREYANSREEEKKMKDAVERFILENKNLISDWEKISSEQKELFFKRVLREGVVRRFLKEENSIYKYIRSVVIRQLSVPNEENENTIASWIKERPDVMSKIYEGDLGRGMDEEYEELFNQSGKMFLPTEIEEYDILTGSDMEIVLKNLTEYQKKILVQKFADIVSDIKRKDDNLVESLFKHANNLKNIVEIDNLSGDIFGRKDLFLRVLKQCGNRKLRDVSSRFEYGNNAGKAMFYREFPLNIDNLTEEDKKVLSDFEDEYGFSCPIDEISESS